MTKIHKKTLVILLNIALLGSSLSAIIKSVQASNSYQRTFVTTAYYSPLPNQSFYVTGSYRGDIILNGNGTNGASGKEVFEGMLAGPKTYAFGTQVACGNILSGTITDRGGAIVPAGQKYSKFGVHSYDRLDIWAGKGEQGLISALKWGKRTLKCTVYPSGNQLKQFVNLPQADFSNIAKKYTRRKPSKSIIASIPQLYQERLKTLGYTSSDKDHLIAFQLSHQLIDSKDSKFAGQFGPATRNKLNEIFYQADNQTPRQDLKENDIDPDVRKLQQFLKAKGYLAAQPTAIFGPKTKAALMRFQLDNKLIPTRKHTAAGYLGPATYEKIKSIILKANQISTKETTQIAQWKHLRQLEIAKKKSIEASNKLAQNKPKTIKETPDEIQNMIKELGEEWVREHTPFKSTQANTTLRLASAQTKQNNEQLSKIKAKLAPLFTPFKKHLRLGSVSEDVKNIQKFLTKTGFYDGKLTTNYFGPKTREAVIAFQIKYNIIESKKSPEAGIVGPKTVETFNMVHIQTSFTLQNNQKSHSIRKPAIHPDDLKPSIQLKQAQAGKTV